MVEIRNRDVSTPHWGVPKRVPSTLVKALTVAGVVVGVAGGVASLLGWLSAPLSVPLNGVSYLLERTKNGVVADDELAHRARYFSPQIFKQLGIQAKPGRLATVSEFKQAADLNPAIAKLYQAPLITKANENRSSLITNSAVAAAGAVFPGGGFAARAVDAIELTKTAKAVAAITPLLGTLGASVAGGMLADALKQEKVDPQMLIEGMHQAIADAVQRGQRPQVPANLVFLLRVSQDPAFAAEIKAKFGNGEHGFHQMNERQQAQVMGTFRALADAATAEANRVSAGIEDVRELAATTPNLNSRAAAYRMGAENATYRPPVVGSFTAREAARRGSPVAPAAARIQPRAGGFAAAVDAQRAGGPQLLS